ncbi:MAG: LacI family DNA-binding transcriptional regulator [Vibrio sp.]
MSLKEIAIEAGVSISTVSRVLNGTATISDETIKKVLQIAEETGYLHKRKQTKQLERSALINKQVLLVVPQQALLTSQNNLISVKLVESIKSLCSEKNVKLNTFISEPNRLSISKLKSLLDKKHFDGILAVWSDTQELLDEIAHRHVPAVLINGEDRAMKIDSVSISNRYGAILGVDYLINQGHKNIALLTYKNRKPIYLRESGFRDSLHEAKLDTQPHTQIISNSFNYDDAYQAVTDWLPNRDKSVTAIFCVTDMLAYGAIKAIQDHGLNVPEDISVMGMDDVLPIELMHPQLTTVRLPFDALALEALALLDEQLFREETEKAYYRHLELSSTLVVRDSVSCI